MRKLFFVLLSLPIAVSAQKNTFVLKGQIGHLNAPAKLYLTYRVDGNDFKDSTTLTDGKFEFKGNIDAEANAMMLLKHPEAPVDPRQRDMLYFYMEKGNIVLNSPDSLHKATFTSGPVNIDNQKLSKLLKPVDERNMALYAEYMAASPEVRESEAFQKTLDAKADSIRMDEKAMYLQFIKGNPKSVISLDALTRFGGGVPDNVNQLDSLFKTLSPAIRSSKKGTEYTAMLDSWKKTAIGQPAPEFTQNDTLGNPVKLADFRGKYVLVDFWASWCGPCRAENPNVVAAFNKYKDKQFTILSVSLDQSTGKEAWLKAVHKDNLTWTHVSDLKFWDNAVAKMYGVRSIPQNFLLDPQGKIVAKNLRGEALDKKLDELLK